MTKPSVKGLVKSLGGPKELAKRLGVTRQAIYQWRSGIPRSRAYELAALSGGRYSIKDLPIAEGPASQRAA